MTMSKTDYCPCPRPQLSQQPEGGFKCVRCRKPVEDSRTENSLVINKTKTNVKQIRLGCSCCHLPSAKIVDGVMVWHSQHNGKTHPNAISLETLKNLLEEAKV